MHRNAVPSVVLIKWLRESPAILEEGGGIESVTLAISSENAILGLTGRPLAKRPYFALFPPRTTSPL